LFCWFIGNSLRYIFFYISIYCIHRWKLHRRISEWSEGGIKLLDWDAYNHRKSVRRKCICTSEWGREYVNGNA